MFEMNLTIFALQTSVMSMSPLFNNIPSLHLQKSSFEHFISPLIFNVYGKISKSVFTYGISSVIILEKEKYAAFTDLDLSKFNGLQVTENRFENAKNQEKLALINIHGDGSSKNVLFSKNNIIGCSTNNEQGLIIISCKANVNVSYNCFASCYSNGATTLYLSTGAILSFITTAETSFSQSKCVYAVNNPGSGSSANFKNINITNANFLLEGSFQIYENSKADISFLHFDTAYNRNAIRFGEKASITMSNCEFFDITTDESIFNASCSFSISNSFFFGLIFDRFVESGNQTIRALFSQCNFDLSEGLIKESFITFQNCLFDSQITFTVQADFLNFGNCQGLQLYTQESFIKQFSTEEIVGMIFCVAGILLTIVLIIIQFLRRNSKIEKSDYEDTEDFDYYEYSGSEQEDQEQEQEQEQELEDIKEREEPDDQDEEDKPRKRK